MNIADVLILVALIGGGLLSIGPIIWLVGRISGWSELAKRFPPAPIAPSARRGRYGTVRFAFGGYNGCVIWASDDDYLHLRLWTIFAFGGHSPLSIPWTEIEFLDRPSMFAVPVLIGGRVRWTLPPWMVKDELALRRAMAEEQAHDTDPALVDDASARV